MSKLISSSQLGHPISWLFFLCLVFALLQAPGCSCDDENDPPTQINNGADTGNNSSNNESDADEADTTEGEADTTENESDIPEDTTEDVPDTTEDAPDTGDEPDTPEDTEDEPDTPGSTDTTPPTIIITSPEDGAILEGLNLRVQGTVVDTDDNGEAGTVTRVVVNGREPNVVDDTFDIRIQANEEGTFTVEVEAEDGAGNVATESVEVDIEALTLSIFVDPRSFTFDTLDDAREFRVRVLYEGRPEETAEDVNVEVEDESVATIVDGMLQPVGEGTTQLVATWQDMTASASITVDLDDIAPNHPAVYSYIEHTNLDNQPWIGQAEPGSTVVVEGGPATLTTTADRATGRFRINVPIPRGTTTPFVATAIDDQGNVSEPIGLSVTHSASTSDAGTLSMSDGNQQKVYPTMETMRPLLVRATNGAGEPLVGVQVRFDVVEGQGRFPLHIENREDSMLAETDGEGRTGAIFQAGPNQIGASLVRATLLGDTGIPVFFEVVSALPQFGETTVEGRVLNTERVGVAGIPILMHTPTGDITTMTDDRGRFVLVLPETPDGPIHEHVYFNGFAIEPLHARIAFPIDILPGSRNRYARPFFIPELGPGVDVDLDEDGIVQTSVTLEKRFDGDVLPTRVHVPAGTKITFPENLPEALRKLWLIDIPVNRTPMPPPDGLFTRHIIALQPGTTRFDPPLQIELPNVDGMAPGEQTSFMSFDHIAGRYVPTGTATTNVQGTYVISDPGSGIRVGAWHEAASETAPERCMTTFTVEVDESQGSSGNLVCSCIMPDGTSIDCKPGQTIDSPSIPCDGSAQSVEVECQNDEDDESQLEITSPTPGSDGKVRVKMGDDINFTADADDPNCNGNIEWSIDGQPVDSEAVDMDALDSSERGGVERSSSAESFSIDAPGTHTVTAKCNVDGQMYQDDVVVETSDCCIAGVIQVCGDNIVDVTPEGNEGGIFEVSGNVIIGRASATPFLRSTGTVICNSSVRLIESKGDGGTLLSMDTATPSIPEAGPRREEVSEFAFPSIKLPNQGLYSGPWHMDGNTLGIAWNDVNGFKGVSVLGMAGFILKFTDKDGFLQSKGVGMDSVFLELPIRSQLKTGLINMAVQTDGMVLGGKFKIVDKNIFDIFFLHKL